MAACLATCRRQCASRAKNTRFRADKGTPTAQAVAYGYSDSVLFSLKIESIHPQRKSLLVNISPVFISDLPPLARYIGGAFDRTRSTWGKNQGVPKECRVESQSRLHINTLHRGCPR